MICECEDGWEGEECEARTGPTLPLVDAAWAKAETLEDTYDKLTKRAVLAKATYITAQQAVKAKEAKLKFIDSRIHHQSPAQRDKTRAPLVMDVQAAINASNRTREAWHAQLDLQTKIFHRWQEAE